MRSIGVATLLSANVLASLACCCAVPQAPVAPPVPNAQEVRWSPGSAHPTHANVLAGDGPGEWRPAPGYVWVKPNDAQTWEVSWSPGFAHPTHANVVAGDTPASWRPAAGHVWVNPDAKEGWEVRRAGNAVPAVTPVESSDGKVIADVAIIQSITPIGQPRQLRYGDPDVQDFSVIVKARKGGTYYVVAGYLHSSSKLWFSGVFSNIPFWGCQTVNLDAGDSITVTIQAHVPPTGTRIYDAGIYYSLHDMKKHR
jgi:hypothetical protein